MDDHHSPTKPDVYIKLRIEPALAFYARRIPINMRRIYLLKMSVLALGVAASMLAHYEYLSWVTVCTAASTSVTSWQEFTDASAKVERYSTSVIALKMLLSWWDSQGEVQRATKESVANLVKTAEAIISEEQLSWTASGSKKEAGAGGDGGAGSATANEGGGGGSSAKVAPAADP